jgi:hypothetical protein
MFQFSTPLFFKGLTAKNVSSFIITVNKTQFCNTYFRHKVTNAGKFAGLQTIPGASHDLNFSIAQVLNGGKFVRL